MEVPPIPGSLMSEHPVTDYFGVWQRYRKVIDANYMHHAVQAGILGFLRDGVSVFRKAVEAPAARIQPSRARAPCRHPGS